LPRPSQGTSWSEAKTANIVAQTAWRAASRRIWRELGFPNLVLADTAKARKQEERLKRARFERARALNPFAIPDDRDYLLELNSRGSRRTLTA